MNVLVVSEGEHEEKALRGLVQRINPQIIHCSWEKVSSNEIQVQPGKGSGLFKRAVAWIRRAQKLKFDALILVIDRDDDQSRMKELDRAQDETAAVGFFPRALGIAIRSFDAWMLADQKALSEVLGFNVPMQPDPEDNGQPKSACTNLLKQCARELKQREMYAQVCAVAEIECLIKRCPKGFGVFAGRVRSLSAGP